MCWTLGGLGGARGEGGVGRYATWESIFSLNEVFKSLNKQEVREIAELELRKTFKRCIWAVKSGF